MYKMMKMDTRGTINDIAPGIYDVKPKPRRIAPMSAITWKWQILAHL